MHIPRRTPSCHGQRAYGQVQLSGTAAIERHSEQAAQELTFFYPGQLFQGLTKKDSQHRHFVKRERHSTFGAPI